MTAHALTAHALKCWPAFFEPVWSGEKTFEIRYDDRGYQRGDQVVLREWDRDRLCNCLSHSHQDANCAKYTGREVHARIGFVAASTPARGSQRGFSGHGYVVLSLCEPTLHGGESQTSAPPEVAAGIVRATVRSGRRAQDMAQNELAAAMAALGHKWHTQTVSQIEVGARRVTAEELYSLSQLLRVPVSFFFEAPAATSPAAGHQSPRGEQALPPGQAGIEHAAQGDPQAPVQDSRPAEHHCPTPTEVFASSSAAQAVIR